MIENKLKANRPTRRGFLSTLFQRKKTQMTSPYRFVEFRMHVSDRTLARFVFNADAGVNHLHEAILKFFHMEPSDVPIGFW